MKFLSSLWNGCKMIGKAFLAAISAVFFTAIATFFLAIFMPGNVIKALEIFSRFIPFLGG